MKRAAFAAAAILVAACSTYGSTTSSGGGGAQSPGSPSAPASLSPAGLQLPTYDPGGAYPAALATGTLERQGGCVVLHDTTDHLLIWPSGTTTQLDDGELVVTEPTGLVLHEHEQVSVGGGEFTEGDFPRPISGLVDACRSYRLWLAAPGQS